MPETVRVAILGNSFAEKVQLPSLRFAGGNKVVGIAGRDGAKARETAERWGIPEASDDYRKILALDPDLVIIATPVDLHAEMVTAALETSAAIVCEKPFTLDAAQAVELEKRATGRLTLIDHQLRWSPYRREMGRLLSQGYVGEPWHARFDMLLGSPEFLRRPHGWWFQAERGGGVLGALGSHMIDAIRAHFGEVGAVAARLVTYVRERPGRDGKPLPCTADEHATLWMRMHSGVEVTLETSVAMPGKSRCLCEYSGSEGILRLRDEEELQGAPHGAELADIQVQPPIPPAAELGVPGGAIFPRLEPLFLRDVVRAIQEGRREVAGAATFADAVATMRVLDAARRSAEEEGAWVVPK